MGGGASRFEETNWESATGKLLDKEDTIDLSDPRKDYAVYYLNKTGVVNQREYFITDVDSNFLYSSRMVEGTLAWFDLLGPLDQYLLRVQVDLSRRYWVIYSYGRPAYEGQQLDRLATGRLRKDRGTTQPPLYKVACITVTWSRFHAIVNRYGPPPPDDEEILSSSWEVLPSLNDKTVFDDDEEEDHDANNSNNNKEREEKEDDLNKITPSPMGKEKKNPSEERMSSLYSDPISENHDDMLLLRESFSPVITPAITSNSRNNSSLSSSSSSNTSISKESLLRMKKSMSKESMLRMKKSMSKESLLLMKKKVKKWVVDKSSYDEYHLSVDPREGYLLLDQPTLKCEEINSFMGQHQTMLIGKEEAKTLMKEEIELRRKQQQPQKLQLNNNNSNNNSKQQQEHSSINNNSKQQVTLSREENNINNNNSNTITTNNNLLRSTKNNCYTNGGVTQNDSLNQSTTITDHDDTTTITTAASTNSLSKPSLKKSSSFSGQISQGTSKSIVKMKKFASWMSYQTQETGKFLSFVMKNSSAINNGLMMTTSNHNDNNNKQQYPSNMNGHNNHDNRDLSNNNTAEEEPPPPVLEPLVGFWNWDNTMRVHKMKMHLAKETDLALHVIMAIVTNQLRQERNVVVSTV